MKTTIRPATENDLPALHGLVTELAEYVNEGPSVTATIEDYRADFAAGFYKALVAEVDGRVVGMTLYYFSYSTWKGRMIYLEDFVISAAHRRSGIGQQLWDALIGVGREHGCRMLKWQILNTNTEALKFYAAQEAIVEDTWLNGKLYL